MKPKVILAVSAAIAGGYLSFVVLSNAARQPETAISVASPAPTAPQSATPAYSENARHFDVSIDQSTDDGSLVEAGMYYDWPPDRAVPDQMVPDGLPSNGLLPAYQTTWSSAGPIFIRGLSDVVDGAHWEGMLEPDGIFRFTTALGAIRTVHAYKFSSAPDPVVAWRKRNWHHE